MLHALMVAAVPAMLCTTAPLESSPTLVVSDSLQQVYRGGQTWQAFYSGVNRRRELWTRTWTDAQIPDDLTARARAVGGPWHILVITEPGCSDSANSVPYIAKLVEQTPGLELRLINSTVGRPWMEAHRTPDGRAATPTVLVLDDRYRLRGCWVEQPAALQEIWLPVVARGTMAQEIGEKMAWYARDEGREIVRELVEVLERAQAGELRCPGTT